MLAKTQKECKEKLAAALERAGKVDAHKTGQFTVGQWAETWFENYAKPAIRETTAASTSCSTSAWIKRYRSD